jgi:lipoprotein-anchoring transpeptidase ErfK/SrfK
LIHRLVNAPHLVRGANLVFLLYGARFGADIMFNRFLSFSSCVLGIIFLFLTPAEAKPWFGYAPGPAVNVVIDISSQSMSVKVNGWYYGHWKVSTARPGYYTPRGSFRVQRTAKVYYSRKYDNSPMPNSVFFKGGYAIHGSYYVRSLGRPASHGCVRLHPTNAARLYYLVQKYGSGSTRVTIVD